MRSLWASVVAGRELQAAYALDATLQELIWILGPLLLSALLLIGGPKTVLIACAGLSLAGNIAYAAGSVPDDARPERATAGTGRLGSRPLVSTLAACGFYGVAVGALTVTLTAFCSEHDAQSAVGLLVAIWGVGSIIGGLAYGTRNWGAPPAQRAMTLLAALAIILALLNLAHSIPILGLLMLALGIPLSPWLGTLNSTIQALVPAERATEGFTWSIATITTGTALGNAAGGPLVHDHLGFTFAAATAATGSILGMLGNRRRDA